MSEQKDLITIELAEDQTALQVFSSEDTVAPYLQLVKDKVEEFTPDLATKKSRKEISSLARKVGTMKTRFDQMAADEKKALEETITDTRAKISAIDATRRHMKKFLSDLQDEAKAPLIEWEEAEKKRVSAIKTRLKQITFYKGDLIDLTSDQLKEIEKKLINIEHEELTVAPDEKVFSSFEEFADEAMATIDVSITLVKSEYEIKLKQEEQAAEIERLKKEAQEREAAERQREAERKAAEEAKIEAAANAERLRQQAESEKKAKEKAELEAEEARQQLVRQQAEAEQRAKEEAVRLAEEKREQEEREEAQRKANKEHQAEVHRAIQADIVECTSLDSDQAFEIIEALYYGKIRHVKVNY